MSAWTRGIRAVSVLFVAFTAAWLLATLTWPLGWDQGIFAWVGSVVVEGGLPYRDAVDLKGPLTFYVFAAAEALLGRNTWGIRLVDALLMLLGAVSLAAVVRRFVGPFWSLWAGCALVLWMGSLGFWGTAQPDGWTAVLLSAALACMVAGGRSPGAGRLAGAAALCGATALFKPFYGAFVALPMLLPWLRRPVDAGRPRPWGLSAVAVLAGVAPALVAVAWFHLHGALGTAVDVHLRYTAGSYSGVESALSPDRARGLVRMLAGTRPLPFALPAIVAGVVAAWRRDRTVTGLLLAWLIAALGFVALQGRFYSYQLLPAYPPFVAFAVVGFQAVLGRERRPLAPAPRSGRGWPAPVDAFLLVALALVLAALSLRPARDVGRAALHLAGGMSRLEYYEDFTPLESFNAADDLRLVRTLRARSRPGERVGVLGWNAGILYLADRPAPTRFGFSHPTHDSTSVLGRRFRDELVDAVRADPPPWFVVGAIHGGAVGLEARYRSHPRLGLVLSERYCVDVEIGHLVLLRLDVPAEQEVRAAGQEGGPPFRTRPCAPRAAEP